MNNCIYTHKGRDLQTEDAVWAPSLNNVSLKLLISTANFWHVKSSEIHIDMAKNANKVER
jgi:hypothetical protein